MVRMRIEVRGIVQGVGFRPFIHRLVSEYGFRGWVRNSSRGVDMELEGKENELRQFAGRIAPEKPLLADVESVECTLCESGEPFTDFEIIESRTMQSRDTLISPDIGICPACLREMRDPADPRYRYPFLNCTNCGPRFTIIKDVPYDRCKTSMSEFPMCPDCDREYHDIEDRRYHAQPDCCPDCGPQVFYEEGGERFERDEAIEQARKRLKEGAILAVKGLGGLHLACIHGIDAAAYELRHISAGVDAQGQSTDSGKIPAGFEHNETHNQQLNHHRCATYDGKIKLCNFIESPQNYRWFIYRIAFVQSTNHCYDNAYNDADSKGADCYDKCNLKSLCKKRPAISINKGLIELENECLKALWKVYYP